MNPCGSSHHRALICRGSIRPGVVSLLGHSISHINHWEGTAETSGCYIHWLFIGFFNSLIVSTFLDKLVIFVSPSLWVYREPHQSWYVFLVCVWHASCKYLCFLWVSWCTLRRGNQGYSKEAARPKTRKAARGETTVSSAVLRNAPLKIVWQK